MDNFLKYRTGIKKMIRKRYQKNLSRLKNKDILCVFYDKIDYSKIKNHYIHITDFQDIEDSVKKIYYYINKLEKDFIILDISIYKKNDRTNYTDIFLASFFCVRKNIYQKEKDTYNKIFQESIINLQKLKQHINKYIDNKRKYLIKFNNLNNFSYSSEISKFYMNFAKETADYEEKLQKGLKYHITKNKEKIERRIPNDFIFRDVYIENIDAENLDSEEEEKTEEEVIEEKNQNNDNRKELLTKKTNKAIAIIYFENVQKSTKYADVLKLMEIESIIVNENITHESKYITVENIEEAEEIIQENKVILITDKKIDVNSKNIIVISKKWKDEPIETEIQEVLLSNREYLKIFANLDNINSIKVLTGTFLNYDGTNYYSGGAERYLIDLHKVCEEIGYKLRIYQKANYDFVRKYQNIEVVGISSKTGYSGEYDQSIEIANRYINLATDTTKLNIYSAFTECVNKNVFPSIGISHGVAWDNPSNKYKPKYDSDFKNKQWIIDAAKRCNKIVSVDTNTANYFQTVDYKLGNSTKVVPNYVNIEEFYPVKHEYDKIVILYPRRLYHPRGLYLLLNIVDKLLAKHDNIEIRLVGKGFKEDYDKIYEKVAKWGKDKIKVYNKAPTEMHKEYKKADISLIPTLYSEGTSLSCLEAMATGNAVIATRIGGLTDLIINNYNGKLIEPNENALYNAIEEFLEDKELLNKCKTNAIEVAKTFSKDKWIKTWKKIISEIAEKPEETANIDYKLVKIYVNNPHDSKLNKIIMKYLSENYLVHIISENNINKESYGRLQYVMNKEELYIKPEITLAEENYKGNIAEDNIEYIK